MISFNPSTEADLRGYEYKVYKHSQIQQVGLQYLPLDENSFELSGFSPSNVITLDIEETSTVESGIASEDFENEEVIVPLVTNQVFYYVKVRSVDTSGNYSSWTSIVRSGQIPLIESAHIRELSASKITSGYIGSEQIVLNGLNSVIKSSTFKPEVRNLQATLEQGSTTVSLTIGTTANLYEGMYLYEIRDNPFDVTGTGKWPGTLSANTRITSIVSTTDFIVSSSHSESGSIKLGAYTKGWSIDGAGNVNFGGSRGISYDGVNVVIGSDVVINAVAPESGGLLITNGANQSLAISSTGAGIGLKINDTINNNGHNYWYVDGSFKVGKTDKHIAFNAGTGQLLIHGGVEISSDVIIGSTSATTLINNANLGAQNPATRINAGTTTISGDRIRTGVVSSNDGTSIINLNDGSLNFKNKFTVDGLGNAFFAGNITSSATISGASGSVSGDFRITERLRVGDGANVTGTTILRVQGDGNTSTTKYPFVVEKKDGTNTFTVREDGRVDVNLGPLFIAGKAHTDHTHSGYLPTTGGTLTGTLTVGSIADNKNIIVRGFVSTTGDVDSDGNVRCAGRFVGGNADNYVYFGQKTGTTDYCFRVNEEYTLYDRQVTRVERDRPIWINSAGTLFTGPNFSSLRYKENINPANLDISSFLNVDVVNFFYKDEFWDLESNPEKEKQLGVIVEQLDDLGLKDLVTYNSANAPDGLNESLIPFYLIETCKQQQQEINELKTRLELLESK
jgi:hypothetical protein